MTTTEIIGLIKAKQLDRGCYTIQTKAGGFAEIIGNRFLVYFDIPRPDSDLLCFTPDELLLAIKSARELPLEAFRHLIRAKHMFGGTILADTTQARRKAV